MKQQTLSIVKPDATAANNVGAILSTFEQNGLTIVACKMTHLSVEKAQQFYAVHKDRPFFGELVDFMVSGPVVVSVLEGDNAIAKNREFPGAELNNLLNGELPGSILTVLHGRITC